VLRPSFHPRAGQRATGRNLGFDLLAAVGVGVTISLVAALLPTIARRGGVDPIGLAALAAAPFIANLLGMFAGRVGPRSAFQLALMRGGGAATLILLVLIPTPPVMVAVAILYWLSLSMSGPFHLRLWGAMYPARLRGRVVGFLGMGRAAAGAIAVLIGGIVADQVGGAAAVALAGLVGLVAAIGFAGLRAPAAGAPPSFSARGSIRALRERSTLSRVALAQGFYGGGLIAATPLFAMVHVDRLDLTMSEVGVLGLLAAVATTVAFLAWGAVADRWGALVAMRIGSLLGLAGLLAYAIAPGLGFLWFAAVVGGIAGASIDVGIAAVISDQTSLASRAAAMAGWNAITGARGIVAAFSMSALLQAGVVDVTTGLLLCAGFSAIGVVLFFRARAGVPVETRAWEVMAAPAAPSTTRGAFRAG
jgi:MFS transporter, DHA1 family, staphyloferrin B biosynthesis exporter